MTTTAGLARLHFTDTPLARDVIFLKSEFTVLLAVIEIARQFGTFYDSLNKHLTNVYFIHFVYDIFLYNLNYFYIKVEKNVATSTRCPALIFKVLSNSGNI